MRFGLTRAGKILEELVGLDSNWLEAIDSTWSRAKDKKDKAKERLLEIRLEAGTA